VTITTTTPHGFTVGDTVVISGVGVAGYNGTFAITGAPSSTTFTYTDGTSGLGASGNGTAVVTSIPLNGSSALSFTIQNNNPSTTENGIGFSDTLPGGLIISTPNGLTGSCGGGTITATQNTNVISLSGASLAANVQCTFSVNVTGTAAGTQNNTTDAITSTESGTGSTSNTATVKVEAPPSIAKLFNPSTISLNATTSLQFTITNPAANVDPLTGVAFTDTLPAGLTVASASAPVCGGTLTTTAATGIALTGATIAVNSQCVFSVTVTGAASGQYTNTTGNVTSTNGGTGNTATANLTVASAPQITKSFSPTSIAVNSNSTLSFTINNPNTNVALSGVAFTDSLPAGLVVATPNGLTGSCGSGTITATAGAGSVSLSGGTLTGSPAVGSSCSFSVSVKGTTAGVKNNSVQVTSTEGGTGNTSNASLTVVGPPTVSKSFNPTSVTLNGNSTLSFTVTNPNTASTLSGVGFTDSLPAGVVVATTPNVTGSCGSGTITGTAGSSTISLSGGTLTASPGAGSACTFSVDVTGTSAGSKSNTTGAVTSTEGGTGATSNTAVLTVVAPPTTTKAFNSTTIAPNGTSTLSITITNPAANTVPLNGVSFTDTFPANLVVANPNGLTNTCVGPATATAGSGSVSLTGGTIPINSSCVVSVNVTSSVGGSYLNSTGPVSTTNGGTGNPASATLSVAFPPTISKLFLPDTVAPSGTTLLSFSISNPNSDPNTNATLTGIAFTDTLPAGLVIASPDELSNTCGGTVTATPGTSSISLSGGALAPAAPALPPGQSKTQVPANQAPANLAQGACFISLKVTAPSALGILHNTTGPITANESGPGATSNTASLTVALPPLPPTISKGFGAASIPLNGTTSLTFTLANPNSNATLMNLSASDTLPAGLVLANPTSLSGSCVNSADITANPGGNTIGITALNLPPSSSCSFSVNVTGTGAGTKNNISGNVTATYDDGTGDFVPIIGGTATASIQVLKGNQTITFGGLPNKTFGDADFSVSATASSGLAVSLAAAGNCTVTSPSPGTVHLTSAGSCTITASQGGDSNYNAAANVAQPFNIAQAATTTALTSSINPSDIGQNVTFTATITPPLNASTPTGTVQFKDGASNLGSAVNCVAGGGNTCTAQVSSSTLTTGTHTITAIYSGDTNFTGSTGTLSGGQVVTNQLALLLILDESGPDPNQAAALESILLLRDPFHVQSVINWWNFGSGPDQNTRVMVFVANLQLNPGDTPSVVVVNLIDGNNQSFDVPAEDVRLNSITGFAQVTFRLPDTLFPGTCTLTVKAHGHVTNSGTIRIAP
jgi:uncharacterized repeat protein (TIGR01451 family)